MLAPFLSVCHHAIHIVAVLVAATMLEYRAEFLMMVLLTLVGTTIHLSVPGAVAIHCFTVSQHRPQSLTGTQQYNMLEWVLAHVINRSINGAGLDCCSSLTCLSRQCCDSKIMA